MPKITTKLILHVKGKYFDQIKSGEKTEEYRLVKAYWFARLSNLHLSQIYIIRGFPSTREMSRECCLSFPWRGVTRKVITHEEFGPDPVDVFAIKLENEQ
jgi:hypothetical protein